MKPLISLSIIIYFLSTISSSVTIPKDFDTSCLTRNSVNNFTIFPVSNNKSSLYYNLLNFSIQNLRFTESTYPKPLAIILPETQEQLANAVLCSRESSWSIRVRCGGHSYEGISSVSTDGFPFVIIDLMNLNRVSIDLESETAWVEGGATLGETYYAIAEASTVHGFSAGSCPTVGSGGHISGGGFGLLSRKYGLAADNVVDALLIDANGKLLDREAMGEDVFWAIRGGGGGVWGIIFAWKIKLVKVPNLVTGFTVSRTGTNRYVANLVHKWQYVSPQLEGNFYLSVFVSADSSEAKTTGISATFTGFFLGPRKRAVSIMRRVFPELGIFKEDCTEMSWIESVLYFSGLDIVSSLKNRYLQGKGYFKAKSDYVRSPIPYKGVRVMIDKLEQESKGYVILDPYGGIMENISSESIAFPHRKGNLFAIQYMVNWEEDSDDESGVYIDWIRSFYGLMTEYVSTAPRAAYVNYLDLDLGVMETNELVDNDGDKSRVWGEKYFLKNYDRLVKAKLIIDPNNVFNHQQGIYAM